MDEGLVDILGMYAVRIFDQFHPRQAWYLQNGPVDAAFQLRLC